MNHVSDICSFDYCLLESSSKATSLQALLIKCVWVRSLVSHVYTYMWCAIAYNSVFIRAIELGLKFDSLLLQFYGQSGTDGTHVNHQMLYFSSLNIPGRMYRKYPAVNTLYIFMFFWEVLLDLCVDRETRLCARDTFCQWKAHELVFQHLLQRIHFTCWQDVAFWGLYISHRCYQKKIDTFTVLLMTG